MSLRQGTFKTTFAVGTVFCLGLGLGAGWKLGWIPIQYAPARTGTLEDSEQSVSEDSLSLTSTGPLAATDDPAPVLTADQIEPPVEEGANQKFLEEHAPRQLTEPDADAPPVIRSPATRQGTKPQAKRPRKVAVDPPEQIHRANFEKETDGSPNRRVAQPAETRDDSNSVSADGSRFAEIDDKLAAGEILAAHKLLSKLYWNLPAPDAELQDRLDATAKKIFFSPQPHFIEPYVIQPGDQLRKVAGKYHLSWEYLALLNKTDPKRIREGQKLKVLKGPFAAIVSLRDFSLTVHLQGYYVKRYLVCIGKDGSSPLGKFTVLGKEENPQYTDPEGKVIAGGDPANPLGKRWLDLGDSYGIHGTIDPDSLGKAESRGCIRLGDADVIEVYNFLVKGSVVEIRE